MVNTYNIDAPYPANIATYDAVDIRHTIMAAMLQHTTDPMQATAGVIVGGNITYSTGASIIAISDSVFVVNTSNPSNGSYLVHAPATSIPVTVADATYDRIDILTVKIYDNYVDNSGQGSAQYVMTQGTASSSPSQPVVPANSLLVATIYVPKSGGGGFTVTSQLRTVNLNASVIPCTSSTRPSQGVPKVGTMIFETDTTKTYLWTGSAWVGVGGGAKLSTNGSRPSNPSAGDICFETDTGNIYFYSGAAWVMGGGDARIVSSTSHPSAPVAGDLIYETDTGAFSVYSGGSWSPIVSSGSNSNGNWTKFADGTMICRYNGTQTLAIGNSYGNFGTNTWQWTFPQGFTSPPIVTVGTARWGSGASWGACDVSYSSNASIRVYDIQTRASGSVLFNLMAIGKWKNLSDSTF